MRKLLKWTCGAVIGALSFGAAAQQFPTKTIRIVVAYSPGGAADLSSRLTAEFLADVIGQKVIVENRPGSGGFLGNAVVADAPPDGYTMLLTNSSFAYIPAMTRHRKLSFDVKRDFAQVAMVARTSNLLVVHPSVPAKSVKELIALAKAHPGKLNYASAGIGGSTHLATELFLSMSGTKITHIPYKGNSASIADLVAGRVDLTIAPIPALVPTVKAGRLRPLATTGAKRSPILPDIPTISESGVPGYEAGSWYGFSVPVKTPEAIVRKLSDAIMKVAKSPKFQDRLVNSVGLEPEPLNAAQFTKFVAREQEKWGKVIVKAGIEVK